MQPPDWCSVTLTTLSPWEAALPAGNGARTLLTPRCWPEQNKGPSYQAVPACCCAGAVLSGGLGGSSGQHPDWAALRPGSPSGSVRATPPDSRARLSFSPNFSPKSLPRRMPQGLEVLMIVGSGSHRKGTRRAGVKTRKPVGRTNKRAQQPTILHGCQTRAPAAL